MNSMKKYLFLFLLTAFSVLMAASWTGCSKKTGCPMTESVGAKTNKKGEFSSKRGNSNLFPKDMRKKKN